MINLKVYIDKENEEKMYFIIETKGNINLTSSGVLVDVIRKYIESQGEKH